MIKAALPSVIDEEDTGEGTRRKKRKQGYAKAASIGAMESQKTKGYSTVQTERKNRERVGGEKRRRKERKNRRGKAQKRE